MSEELEAITNILVDIYGDNYLVRPCAEEILTRLPKWQEEADQGWRSVDDSVYLHIWNYFAGGSTAEIAADRVMAVLNEDN